MDKPKIRLFPSGLEIESGFIVEFDEQSNIKINGEECPTWVLFSIADKLHRDSCFAEELAAQKAKKENRIDRFDFWGQVSFYPKFEDRFKKEGIYIIDGVYVGKSVHINNRIKTHVSSAINDEHVNKKLGLHIKNKLFCGEELKIQWIKTNASPYNEAIVINHMLNKGIDLLNSDYRMLALLEPKTEVQ